MATRLSDEFRAAVAELWGEDRVEDEVDGSEDPAKIERPLRKLLEPFVDLGRCDALDFGCGPGASTVVLARMGAKSVLGIDPCEAAVAAARIRARDCGLEQVVSFLWQEDTAMCPLPSASFDLIVLNAVLEHVPPQARRGTMSEVWRMLRPGGFVCINETPNAAWPVESHTTKLFALPYMPASVALWCAKCAGRIPRDQTLATALTRGLRGVRLGEILGALPSSEVRWHNDAGAYDSIGEYFRNPRARRAFRLLSPIWRCAGGRPAAMLPSWRLVIQKVETPD
jgi:2-polyprenyl-3-methyl-5-hydroxy-6-metoxy-1,4-benzoquinol methylase